MDRKAIAIVVLRILAARGDFFSGNGTASQRRKSQIEAASCLSCSYVTSRAPCILSKKTLQKKFLSRLRLKEKEKSIKGLLPSTNPEPYDIVPAARPDPVTIRTAQDPRIDAEGTTPQDF